MRLEKDHFRILGDENWRNNKDEPVDIKNRIFRQKKSSKLKFIIKPRAGYTEEARQKSIEGNH